MEDMRKGTLLAKACPPHGFRQPESHVFGNGAVVQRTNTNLVHESF